MRIWTSLVDEAALSNYSLIFNIILTIYNPAFSYTMYCERF